MRYLVSSAVFGLIPVPLEANASGDERGNRHLIDEDVQHPQTGRRSPADTEQMATKAELARLRGELGINVGNRSKRRGARYQILGRGWGAQRIHLLLNHEDEVDAKARELAAMPGQSPVVVIDTDRDRAVTFYFADGHVCAVLRKPPR
jgi:hypothetical protein